MWCMLANRLMVFIYIGILLINLWRIVHFAMLMVTFWLFLKLDVSDVQNLNLYIIVKLWYECRFLLRKLLLINSFSIEVHTTFLVMQYILEHNWILWSAIYYSNQLFSRWHSGIYVVLSHTFASSCIYIYIIYFYLLYPSPTLILHMWFTSLLFWFLINVLSVSIFIFALFAISAWTTRRKNEFTSLITPYFTPAEYFLPPLHPSNFFLGYSLEINSPYLILCRAMGHDRMWKITSSSRWDCCHTSRLPLCCWPARWTITWLCCWDFWSALSTSRSWANRWSMKFVDAYCWGIGCFNYRNVFLCAQVLMVLLLQGISLFQLRGLTSAPIQVTPLYRSLEVNSSLQNRIFLLSMWLLGMGIMCLTRYS